MKEVLKKGLLVVLAIMLCAMPVVAFSGCDDDNIVEITNIERVGNIHGGSYQPYKNTVWLNKSTQRITFYVIPIDDSKMQLIDYPYNECSLTYEKIDKVK